MICNGNSSGMAVKGGNNDEPHNHNDIGNFIYLYKGIEFLVDLGAGEYCRDYFNENRYTIFCNTSESHNVPILNNRLQEAGKQYCCSGFKTNGKDCAVLEFAGAYEAGLVEKIERQLHFDNIDGELQVCDSFVISEKTESIQENLVTRQAVSVEGNVCFLSENGIRCKIAIDTVPARELSIEVIEKIHINHTGQEEQIHLIRWTVFSAQNDSSLAEGRVICSFRIIPE
jgi:hypothetical protein